MDMQLVPKYADEGQSEAGVTTVPARTQSLSLRVVEARMGSTGSSITAPATIPFHQRDVTLVQDSPYAFVHRVYSPAPDSIVGAGAPLPNFHVPELTGNQAASQPS